jgi:hypothetical protein
MMRSATLLFLLASAITQARAQDDSASYDKGQKYLEKVAKVWSSHLPAEKLCGLYMGRLWVGSVSILVKATTEQGAAFELSMKGSFNALTQTVDIDSRSLYTGDLAPVAFRYSEKSNGKTEKRTLTINQGEWQLRIEKEGDVTQKKGKMGPGTALDAVFLPLFESPHDDSLTLDSADSQKTVCHFRRLAELRERPVNGKMEKCTVLEIVHPREEGDLWFFRSDGTPLEFRPGDTPIRIRPITEAEKGKPLNEPLEFKPAERRLVDLCVAASKNDAASVSACFDFQRFSAETVPGFADFPENKKKEFQAGLATNLPKDMIVEMRRVFPDPALVEDMVSCAMRTTEKDGVARIQMFGQQTWKLYEVKEGPRKGQWLIFGIEQQ